MTDLFSLGMGIIAVTLIVEVGWLIYFTDYESGPPPDWVLYPIPLGMALVLLGLFHG
jgi:hypothetical protein